MQKFADHLQAVSDLFNNMLRFHPELWINTCRISYKLNHKQWLSLFHIEHYNYIVYTYNMFVYQKTCINTSFDIYC